MRVLMGPRVLLMVLTVGLLGVMTHAQGKPVEFGSESWVLADAQVTEHLGRTSLAGSAFLKEAVFENGVIEVDVAFSGARSYPGVLFRIQGPGENERVYIRPHRSGQAQYPDVVQYVPTFNGVDSWQLYSGEGFTAFAPIPSDQWLHLKIEVSGTRARVFIGDSNRPALLIHALKHGLSKGTIGLMGPRDGSAFFSNFSYRTDDTLTFDPPPKVFPPPGLVADWQLSPPYKALGADRARYPGAEKLAAMGWKAVKAEPDGLLDFSRTFGRLGPAPDCILAKTVIPSDKDQIKKYLFGYSDEVTIFLNGTPLFTGDSTYRYRDPSFLGIAGLFDALYLPLKKGDNELLFLVTENMGGWGLILQDATAVYSAPGISEAWKTPADFLLPETAVYDPASRAIYVSGYDAFNRSLAEGKQYVSKLSLDGKIEKLKWAEGLKNPAGMAVTGGKLYVAEPASLAEVDIASGKLLQRYPVAGAMMLNDLAAGPDGSLYISDSRTSVIYKFSGGKAEEWLSGAWIARPNGMHISGNELLVGNNGDGCLKGVDLSTKAVRTIADLGQGIIDGIEEDGKGNVLVSHNEGRLFRVAPSGEVTKLLDTTVVGQNLANFAYLPDRGLLVIPTWIDSRVVAYTLDAK